MKIYLLTIGGIFSFYLFGDSLAQAQELKHEEKYKYLDVANPFLVSQLVKSSEKTAESTLQEQKSGLVSTWINRFRNNDLPGDFQIHGFASQAYITTSDNNVFGNSSNDGSFGLTEAGLNASVRPLPRLQLSGQVVSRRAGEGVTGMPRLDYAFLDYRLYSHEAHQFGIRAGRLKNPFGFYNETRDVAHTRPSILLPQSIYFDRTRNLGLSGDSVQVYGETAIGRLGTFSTQFGIWFPIVSDKDTESSILGGVRLGDLTREASYIGRGIFETHDKRLRLGISGIWLNTTYDPQFQNPREYIGPGSFQFTPIYFSAQYNAEKWTLTAEYALRQFSYDNKFGVGVDPVTKASARSFNGLDFIGESYYIQGEYRFTPKWEGFLRYDALFTNRDDRGGKQFAQLSGGLAHSRFAKDITAGLRWNITPQFMLRGEYHYVNGTGWLSRLDNPKPSDTEQYWHLFAIQAAYRF